MADLSITAASVAKSSGDTTTGTAGATITAGQTLYIDTGDANKLKLADANASALTATVAGIALHGSVAGQPITYQTSGVINLGATLEAGKVYVQSATAGGIAPVADLATGHRSTVIGVASSTSLLVMRLYNSGVAIA